MLKISSQKINNKTLRANSKVGEPFIKANRDGKYATVWNTYKAD